MLKNLTTLFTFAWLCQTCLFGQTLPFYNAASAKGVDYQSFPGMLMLRHSIGEFSKLPKNPLLQPDKGNWDSRDVADPFLMVTADSIVLFYDGNDNDRYHIGYAVMEKDGWAWRKRGKVFSGSGQEWDSYHQIAPVVFNDGTAWRMYYNGNSSDDELGYQWGLAERQDNGLWKAQTQPLMALDSLEWDFSGQVYGDILYLPQQKLYRMWYTGFQGPLASIGVADSPDGRKWRRAAKQPVLANLPGVISPDVLFNGESYEMFYVQLYFTDKGIYTKIMRAESADGLSWSNMRDVLLPAGKWEKHKLMRPHLAYFENRIYLYYCGARSGRWRIGAGWADADFQSGGSWVSQALPAGKQVQIKYEVPQGTTLLARLLPQKGDVAVAEVPLTGQGTPLRSGVFAALLDLPSALQRGGGRLELRLTTTLDNHSPVVYSVQVSGK